MAFIVSSASLLIVISCLILSLYRNSSRSREQEELQNQLQTISQLLGEFHERSIERIFSHEAFSKTEATVTFVRTRTLSRRPSTKVLQLTMKSSRLEWTNKFEGQRGKIDREGKVDSTDRGLIGGESRRFPSIESSSCFSRRSDPAVSYQSSLLDVNVDESDIPSTSSMESDSPYFTGRHPSHENFMPSVHMLGSCQIDFES
jgi:hypothetical protein